jgi:hypothetical protein
MFIRVMICCSSSVACRLNWPSRSRATAVYVLVTAVRVYAATAADRSGRRGDEVADDRAAGNAAAVILDVGVGEAPIGERQHRIARRRVLQVRRDRDRAALDLRLFDRRQLRRRVDLAARADVYARPEPAGEVFQRHWRLMPLLLFVAAECSGSAATNQALTSWATGSPWPAMPPFPVRTPSSRRGRPARQEPLRHQRPSRR